MHKTQPLLRLNPSHAQTCKSITHSRVWILLIHASILHKPHPLVRLNPSHKSIKPAQTSPTLASESFSDKHQTCTKHNHSCLWILLMHKHAQTSPTPASESLSCMHQTCTNLSPSCVWILIMRASNLHKPHPLLCLNPSHTCTSSAQTSATPASESFSCLHKTCTNLTHSCVWILLIQASNLRKLPPLLRLNPSHTRIKPAQTPPTPASESFSSLHQTCKNLTHSCAWISFIHASNPPKPHKLLRFNPSHTSIKPAQTSLLLRLNPSHTRIKPAQNSPTPASESFSRKLLTCTNPPNPASESFS